MVHRRRGETHRSSALLWCMLQRARFEMLASRCSHARSVAVPRCPRSRRRLRCFGRWRRRSRAGRNGLGGPRWIGLSSTCPGSRLITGLTNGGTRNWEDPETFSQHIQEDPDTLSSGRSWKILKPSVKVYSLSMSFTGRRKGYASTARQRRRASCASWTSG